MKDFFERVFTNKQPILSCIFYSFILHYLLTIFCVANVYWDIPWQGWKHFHVYRLPVIASNMPNPNYGRWNLIRSKRHFVERDNASENKMTIRTFQNSIYIHSIITFILSVEIRNIVARLNLFQTGAVDIDLHCYLYSK